MMFGRVSRGRTALMPALLALLHISTAVGEPIMHGRTEVLNSARAFEQGHSARCAVIHLESSCVAGSIHQFGNHAAPQVALHASRLIPSVLPVRNSLLPSFGVSLVNGERGPPQG